MIASASWKWPSARAATASQTCPSPALVSTASGSVRDDAGLAQLLLRQIEPADPGVLVDVAQNVGELQRAAEMMRERNAVLLAHAEHPDRQPPDRARDAVAVKVERRPVRRADILGGIHRPCRRSRRGNPPCGARNRAPPAPARAAPAPAGRHRAPRSARAIPRAQACARHAARWNRRRHRPAGRTNRFRTSPRVARAAISASRCRTSCPRRGLARRSCSALQRVWRRSSAGDLLTAPGAPAQERPNNPFAAPSAPNAATPSFAQTDIFAQRVSGPQQLHEMPRQRDDGGDLQRRAAGR